MHPCASMYASQARKVITQQSITCFKFWKDHKFPTVGSGLNNGKLQNGDEPKLATKSLPSLEKLATKRVKQLLGSHIKSYSYSNPLEKQTSFTYYLRRTTKSQSLKFFSAINKKDMLYRQHILVCEHVTPGILLFFFAKWKGKTSSGKFATFRGGGSKKI